MQKTYISAAVAFAAALATTSAFSAYAAPEGHRWGHDIKIADVEAHAKAMFDRIDTNHDGSVSRAEFDAAPRPPMMRGMRRMHEMGSKHGMEAGHDMDHDMAPMHGAGDMDDDDAPSHDTDGAGPDRDKGRMHRPDPKVELPALFKRLDTNNDGKLTNAEFGQLPAAHRAQMREHMFKFLDKDGNGSLSRDEFPPFVAHLKALDRNGDGTVTRDELPRHDRGMHHRGDAPGHDEGHAPQAAH